MLIKVQYGIQKKYVKVGEDGLHYTDFIKEVVKKFGLSEDLILHVCDDTGTEIDEEVFGEIIKLKPEMCYIVKDVGAEFPLAHSSPSSCTDTLSVSSASEQDAGPPAKRTQLSPDRATDAKELVKNILMKKPGGEKIMQEYWEKRTLSDCTRRQLINMLVAYMTEE